MWNAGANFRANSTAKNAPKARDFAASEWEAEGLGIEQCWEMRVVFCGGETGEGVATEAGGRTAKQTDNIFATINTRSPRYR